VQVCTSLQTDNHTSTSPLSFFTGRMPFLPPNQQRQSTEGTKPKRTWRDIVEKNCQARKLNKEDAVDRSRWRKLIEDV